MSHRFPSGTLTEGDFRDRLCRRIAAEVEKRTNGGVQSLGLSGFVPDEDQRPVLGTAQGRAHMRLVSVSCAGGEVAETNIGLMPALVPSHGQGAARKTADVGKQLARVIDNQGILIVSWISQASGVATGLPDMAISDLLR